ncbi:MAG: VanZ family protein [Bacteroidia bacterium]|nr:VanZ family protein [Bacteroidia bacterium]
MLQSFRAKTLVFYGLPVVLWMTVIFLLSDQTKDESKGLSDLFLAIFRFLDLDPVRMQELGVPHLIRKAAHVTEYFILYLLVYRLVYRHYPEKTSLLWTLMICIVYAASDEYHQTFVPGRGGQVSDVGVDSIGMILALLGCWKMYGRTGKEVKNA